MALPRETPVADASLYDRILIMATTTAVAPLRPQQPASQAFPGMQARMAAPRAAQHHAAASQSAGASLARDAARAARIPPIRWTIRRSRQPLPPVSFPFLRSTPGPRLFPRR